LKDTQGINIVASNNSWGGTSFSQALQDAIDRQRQSGILFIAAAGNDFADNDIRPFYPAASRCRTSLLLRQRTGRITAPSFPM